MHVRRISQSGGWPNLAERGKRVLAGNGPTSTHHYRSTISTPILQPPLRPLFRSPEQASGLSPLPAYRLRPTRRGELCWTCWTRAPRAASMSHVTGEWDVARCAAVDEHLVSTLLQIPRRSPGDYEHALCLLVAATRTLTMQKDALEVDLTSSQEGIHIDKLPSVLLASVLEHVVPDDALAVALVCRVFNSGMLDLARASTVNRTRRFRTSLMDPNMVRRLEWALGAGLPRETVCEAAAYRGHWALLKRAHELGCPFGDASIALCYQCPGGEEEAAEIYEWLKTAGAPTTPDTDRFAEDIRTSRGDAKLRFQLQWERARWGAFTFSSAEQTQVHILERLNRRTMGQLL
jgi:hypothetical protein